MPIKSLSVTGCTTNTTKLGGVQMGGEKSMN